MMVLKFEIKVCSIVKKGLMVALVEKMLGTIYLCHKNKERLKGQREGTSFFVFFFLKQISLLH